MLIYFNGDSFTEGAGLADHKFFQDYPGDLDTMEEVRKNEWNQKRFKFLEGRDDLRNNLLEMNNRRAYPSYVNKLLPNAEIINAAVGGSSMKGTLMRTMYDLEELSSKGKQPTHVFIGLTWKERLAIYNVTKSIDRRSLTHTCIPDAVTLRKNQKSWKKWANATWESHDDEHLLINLLSDSLMIKLYIENKFNITPIFLDTYGYFWIDTRLCEESESPLIKMLWNLLDIEYIKTAKTLKDFSTKFVADGHFTEIAHVGFAEYIVNEYLKN